LKIIKNPRNEKSGRAIIGNIEKKDTFIEGIGLDLMEGLFYPRNPRKF